MNWLLIAVAIFWIIMAIVGIKKGFLRMLYSISALVISLILTIVFYSQVADLICEKTQFDEFLYEKYTSYIEEKNSEETEEPSFILQMAESVSLDTENETFKAIEKLVEEGTEGASNAVNEITSEISHALALKLVAMTINVVAFVLTLLVIGIILLVILNIIKVIEKIPVIKGMNRFLGFVLGAGMGLIIIWIVFAFITVLAATSFGNECLKCISESELLTWIYKANIFTKLF